MRLHDEERVGFMVFIFCSYLLDSEACDWGVVLTAVSISSETDATFEQGLGIKGLRAMGYL